MGQGVKMSDFFVQNKVTNKIIEQISEKMFCEVTPKRPRKPNGVAQRYSPNYRSDIDPYRKANGAPTVVSVAEGNTTIGDIESAVAHVSGQNGPLSAVPDEFLADTILRDLATEGQDRFEIISVRETTDGVDGILKFRDTVTGMVYGLKHHEGSDALDDAGQVEILVSRVAEEFGFAQGRMRVASGIGDNGSFAVLMEMPDSVVAGDTRDLRPEMSVSQADTDDVVRLALMDFVLANPSRSPLDVIGSSDDEGMSLHPVPDSGALISNVGLRDRQALESFVADAMDANHPALLELRKRLEDPERREEVIESLRRLRAELVQQGTDGGLRKFNADTLSLERSASFERMKGKRDAVSDRMATVRLTDTDELVSLFEGATARPRPGATVVGRQNPGSPAVVSQEFAQLTPKQRAATLNGILQEMPHLESVLELSDLTRKKTGKKVRTEKRGTIKNLTDDQVTEALDRVLQHFEDNIDYLLSQSPPDAPGRSMLAWDVDEGRYVLTPEARVTQAWYDVANNLAGKISDESGVRPESAAAVLAVLSASSDWRDNVPLAINSIRIWAENPTITAADVEVMRRAYIDAKNSSLKERMKRGVDVTADRELLKRLDNMPVEEYLSLMDGKLDVPLHEQDPLFVSHYIRSRAAKNADGSDLGRVDLIPSDRGDGSFDMVMIEGVAASNSHSASTLIIPSDMPESEYKLETAKTKVVNASLQVTPDGFISDVTLSKEPGSKQHRDLMAKVTKGADRSAVFLSIEAQPELHSFYESLGFVVTEETGKGGVPILRREPVKLGNYSFDKIARILQGDANNTDLDTTAFVERYISPNLGEYAKVRSFYNNIADPADTQWASLTADTHHFNAVSLIPIGSTGTLHAGYIDNNGNEVLPNNPRPYTDTVLPKNNPFIGKMFDTNKTIGFSGSYWLAREAALRKAQEYGILPREMQSILWEHQRRMWVDQKLKTGVGDAILREIRQLALNGDSIGEEEFRKLYQRKYDEAMQGWESASGAPAVLEDTRGFLEGLQ